MAYSDTSTVELLLVHLLDSSIGLGLLTVGLSVRKASNEKRSVHTTKPKPLDRPVSLSFMTIHYMAQHRSVQERK
jgi:hypothetical protein